MKMDSVTVILEDVNEILLFHSYFLIYEISRRQLHVMALSICEYLNFSSDLDKIRDIRRQQFIGW